MDEYWKNFTVVDETRDDLGGNLRHGDTMAILPRFWRYLIDRFAVRTMLDVGCGEGHALRCFYRMGVIAHGIDGLKHNAENAVYPMTVHDITKSPYCYSCDLVHCVEVVEHIEDKFVDNVLQTMMNAPVVVMTHGEPGQAGYHHVNLQPKEYWIKKFETRGYTLSIDNELFREMAGREISGSYFSTNGLVFLKNR